MKKNHLVGDALILTVSDQIEELDYLILYRIHGVKSVCMMKLGLGKKR